MARTGGRGSRIHVGDKGQKRENGKSNGTRVARQSGLACVSFAHLGVIVSLLTLINLEGCGACGNGFSSNLPV